MLNIHFTAHVCTYVGRHTLREEKRGNRMQAAREEEREREAEKELGVGNREREREREG